jgi:hypothetical protein
MSSNKLKHIARERIAETIGNDYAYSADAAVLIDAFAYSLARGCLVILDSKTQVIYFRNVLGQKVAGKKIPM